MMWSRWSRWVQVQVALRFPEGCSSHVPGAWEKSSSNVRQTLGVVQPEIYLKYLNISDMLKVGSGKP